MSSLPHVTSSLPKFSPKLMKRTCHVSGIEDGMLPQEPYSAIAGRRDDVVRLEACASGVVLKLSEP